MRHVLKSALLVARFMNDTLLYTTAGIFDCTSTVAVHHYTLANKRKDNNKNAYILQLSQQEISEAAVWRTVHNRPITQQTVWLPCLL